jgi:hypothetical protein
VDLTCRCVGPMRCSDHLRRPPPLQLLLFESFLLYHLTVFHFVLFLYFFFVCFMASDPPSTVPLKFLAALPLQQPHNCYCCLHSNRHFFEFVCQNHSGLFIEFHCNQNPVAQPQERPNRPCLVLAIACCLVLLNQIQILPSMLLLILVLLLGFVGCLTACNISISCFLLAVLS